MDRLNGTGNDLLSKLRQVQPGSARNGSFQEKLSLKSKPSESTPRSPTKPPNSPPTILTLVEKQIWAAEQRALPMQQPQATGGLAPASNELEQIPPAKHEFDKDTNQLLKQLKNLENGFLPAAVPELQVGTAEDASTAHSAQGAHFVPSLAKPADPIAPEIMEQLRQLQPDASVRIEPLEEQLRKLQPNSQPQSQLNSQPQSQPSAGTIIAKSVIDKLRELQPSV